jgi:hypothetical protein
MQVLLQFEIRRDSPNEAEYIRHQPNYRALDNSARSGCELCSMLQSLLLNACQCKIDDYGDLLRDPHANYLRREGTIRLASPGRLLDGFHVATEGHREKASVNVYTKPGAFQNCPCSAKC